MTKEKFMYHLEVYRKLFPNQRIGQAVFNCASHLNIKRLDKFINTDLDPYYNDDVVEEFIDKITT